MRGHQRLNTAASNHAGRRMSPVGGQVRMTSRGSGGSHRLAAMRRSRERGCGVSHLADVRGPHPTWGLCVSRAVWRMVVESLFVCVISEHDATWKRSFYLSAR